MQNPELGGILPVPHLSINASGALISFLINPFGCNMKVWALSWQDTSIAFVSNPCLAVKQARPLTSLVWLFMFIESQPVNIDMSVCMINILSHSKLLCPDCKIWLAPCLSPGLLLPSPLLSPSGSVPTGYYPLSPCGSVPPTFP
jgi:hypothetical protein